MEQRSFLRALRGIVLVLVIAGAQTLAAFAQTTGTDRTSAVPLTLDAWVNGQIVAAGSGGAQEQWFTFTATADTQYLHIRYSTMRNLDVQVYDSDEITIGAQTNLHGNSGEVGNFSRTVYSGETYYIKVTPGYGSRGNYRIGFTDFPVRPGTTIPQMTVNTWSNGNIAESASDGAQEQWFKFTATAANQYIHIQYSTMINLDVQVYDEDLYTVGDQTNLYGNSGATGNFSRTVTVGAAYYIKVTPGSSYYSGSNRGNYRIGFTGFPVRPGTAIPQMTANTWVNGNIAASATDGAQEQWFKFTATAANQYIHIQYSTMRNLDVQVYDEDLYTVGDRAVLQGNSGAAGNFSRTVTAGATYYIKVTPGYGSRGNYRIGFADKGTWN
jgi:hypothetical protein